MKRFSKCIPALITLSMIAMLTACGGLVSGGGQSKSAPAASPPVLTGQSTAENSGTSTPDISDKATSLVVYFSWSGNTEQMAEWIADESESDIYRVTPAEAYAEDFDGCADRAKNELDNGIRPELADRMDTETMAKYDTIYVGFPIWWYDLPMAMTAFLEQYDLSSKTIIPFFSHNGSSSGAAASDTLTEICTGAAVLAEDALSISGNSVENSETQIREWVTSINQ